MPLLHVLKTVFLAPGRLWSWFCWALPGAGYHDDVGRDDRAGHWILATGFWAAVGRALYECRPDGVIGAGWPAIRAAYGLN